VSVAIDFALGFVKRLPGGLVVLTIRDCAGGFCCQIRLSLVDGFGRWIRLVSVGKDSALGFGKGSPVDCLVASPMPCVHSVLALVDLLRTLLLEFLMGSVGGSAGVCRH